MKERPILMSAPMVRALLDGSKTQTRRVVKPQFAPDAIPCEMVATNERGHQIVGHSGMWWCEADGNHEKAVRCPYGQPGDRLWVRETWNWFDPKSIPEQRLGMRADFTGKEGERQIQWCAAYAADGPLPYPGYDGRDHWRPSIHMPRWASRITLEITGVRVERVQEIDIADASAEGVTDTGSLILDKNEQGGPIAEYAVLWESINGPGSWEQNPWVWVIEFKLVVPA